ncbi:hypothetical protein CR513_22377, partial [Mucuna pruriens]
MRPQGISEDYIKMKAFPFSLDGAAKDWLYLQPVLFNTWGALINVMPTSIYRTLNFGDLQPTGMTIQLANRSIVQPLGVMEDVLVQISELIFPAEFYVLDMEDETAGNESTLILGRPFLMTARTKIDVHAGTLLMEFSDALVQFNIFEAMKHPTEDHSLFGIDLIEELVEEYLQLDSCSGSMEDFAEVTDIISCLGTTTEEADNEEVHTLSSSEDEYDGIMDPSPVTEKSPLMPPPMELKPLPNHLKYV